MTIAEFFLLVKSQTTGQSLRIRTVIEKPDAKVAPAQEQEGNASAVSTA